MSEENQSKESPSEMASEQPTYTEVFEAIQNQPWPPQVRFDNSSDLMELTEYDVSWLLCQTLGMKWGDAQELSPAERKYLYAKSLQVAEMMERHAIDAARIKEELQAKFEEKVSSLEISPAEVPAMPLGSGPPQMNL